MVFACIIDHNYDDDDDVDDDANDDDDDVQEIGSVSEAVLRQRYRSDLVG